jgi:hypothetical protein
MVEFVSELMLRKEQNYDKEMLTNGVGNTLKIFLKNATVRCVLNQRGCLLGIATNSHLDGAGPLDDIRHEI